MVVSNIYILKLYTFYGGVKYIIFAYSQIVYVLWWCQIYIFPNCIRSMVVTNIYILKLHTFYGGVKYIIFAYSQIVYVLWWCQTHVNVHNRL